MTIATADVVVYLNARGLAAKYPDAVVLRGRADQVALAAGVGRMVVISRGVGPGLTGGESHFDSVMWDIRVVGEQGVGIGGRDDTGAYDRSEQFATDVDLWMQSDGAVQVGSVTAYGVFRAGGAPTHIDTDKARRAHWHCSYITPVASGL